MRDSQKVNKPVLFTFEGHERQNSGIVPHWRLVYNYFEIVQENVYMDGGGENRKIQPTVNWGI